MALYRKVPYTTTGVKESLNMDAPIAPFNASVAVTVGTTATYKMQFSLDPMDVQDADAFWFDSVNIPAGTTASILSNVAFPVSRVRFDIAAISGTMTVQIQQGFTIN